MIGLSANLKTAYRIRRMLLVIALIAPAFILFTAFVVVPVIQAAYYSFFDWNGLGPLVDFQGFRNFVRAFQHDVFRTAIWNNVRIVVLSLLLQLPTAFLFSLLIGRKKFFGSLLFRSFYFLPYVLAEIVVGIVWRFIYNPQRGLPTFFVQLFTGSQEQIGLLGDVHLAFWAVFMVIYWKYIGLHMIIYIAGLQGVPQELEDAAAIDGASKTRIVFSVIIPSMWSAIVMSVFLCVIGSFNVFDVVWAMGQGGPVHSTETLVTYLYNFGFRRFAFGYGSAVAIVIFLICVVFNYFYQKFVVSSDIT